VRPRTNSTALMLSPPLRCTKSCPNQIFPFERCIFSLLQAFYLSSIPMSLATRPGLVRVPFSRDFRLEARCGTRGFGLGTCLAFPLSPFRWVAAQDSENAFCSLRGCIPVSVFPGHRDRVGDSEQGRRTDAELIRNWLHESVRSLTKLALKIP
jgi:hypothetical protein